MTLVRLGGERGGGGGCTKCAFLRIVNFSLIIRNTFKLYR